MEYAPLPPCLILKISPTGAGPPAPVFCVCIGSFWVIHGRGGACLARPRSGKSSTNSVQCTVSCAMLPDVSLRGAKRRGNLAGPGRTTGYSRRKRNCLPEIAPQGHFLALRAQGATAPSGPRNDKSGAIAVLAIACANRQCSAGSGMPLPYNKGTIDSAPQKSKRSRPVGGSSPARIGGQGFFWISSPLSDSASE